MQFQVAGKKVQVETYKTSWPLSVVWKKQGVQVKVNPHGHWYCLWLCESTDKVDEIHCSIRMTGPLAREFDGTGSCRSCGDLTVAAPGSAGFSAPWLYQQVSFEGTIKNGSAAGSFSGNLVF